MDYYLGTHMPLVRERWMPLGLHEAKIVTGASTPDGGPAPFQVMALLTWESADAFEAGIVRHGDEIFGDIPRFTNVQPTGQINEFPE